MTYSKLSHSEIKQIGKANVPFVMQAIEAAEQAAAQACAEQGLVDDGTPRSAFRVACIKAGRGAATKAMKELAGTSDGAARIQNINTHKAAKHIAAQKADTEFKAWLATGPVNSRGLTLNAYISELRQAARAAYLQGATNNQIEALAQLMFAEGAPKTVGAYLTRVMAANLINDYQK